MKINSLTITGMHNIPKSKTYMMEDIIYLYGNNGAGKSTVMQAIQLALLGYIPGTDKNKTAIFRHANGNTMSVDITFDTGDKITRIWNKKGSTIEADMSNTFDIQSAIADIELPIFNFNEFANMSANKLKDWFINFLPDADTAIDWEDELKAVTPKNIESVDSEAITESLAYIADTQGSELERARYFNEFCKMKVSAYKSTVNRLTDTMQSLVHYDDFDTNLTEADVAKYIEMKDTELQQIRSKISVYKANANSMKALDGMRAKYKVRDPDELEAIKVGCELELSTLKNDKIAFDAEMTAINNQITTAQAESFSYKRILDSKGMCPYTKTECDSMQKQIATAEAQKQVSDNNIKDLMDRHTAKSAELREVTERMTELKYKMNNLAEDKAMFESLVSTVDESIADVNIDELRTNEAECITEIKEKQDILVKIKANKQYYELQGKIATDIAEAEELLNIYKAYEKLSGVNGLQSKIMVAPFEKFSATITKYLISFFDDITIKAAFNVGEKANSFSFGLIRDGSYLDFDLLSSGEKCLYTLSLLIAIVENSSSSLKLIMVDDLLDHLDDNRIYDVFRTLYKSTDVQVIMAGVKPCTYEPVTDFVINL